MSPDACFGVFYGKLLLCVRTRVSLCGNKDNQDIWVYSRVHLRRVNRLVLVRRVDTSSISNRAVKPRTADGTAVTSGRVGRCHLMKKGEGALVSDDQGSPRL